MIEPIKIIVLLTVLRFVDANLLCIAENWRANSVKCTVVGSKIFNLTEIPISGNKQNAKVVYLYMKSCELHFLSPNTFSKTPDVQVLDLSDNRIANPDVNIFKGMNELRALNLSYNIIEKIDPQLFESLAKLRDLDLSGNFLTISSGENIFKGLLSLRTLDISYNPDIKIVPDLFSDLSLKTLSMISAYIELPDTYILDLPNLVNLDISMNRRLLDSRTLSNLLQNCFFLVEVNINDIGLEAIESEAFKENVRLRILRLSRNSLTYLDSDLFSRNPSLLLLDLSNNILEALPNQIFQKNKELLEIDLSHNKLKRLGVNTFEALTRLQVLKLNNNSLTTLQNGIFSKNTELDTLDLSNNKIKIVNPVTFSNKPLLRFLNLAHNGLEKMTFDIIKNMKRLAVLNLDNNKLKTIQLEIFEFPLNDLFLSCNEFVWLPEDILKINSPKKIYLHGNPWDCGCLNKMMEFHVNDSVEIDSRLVNGREISCIIGSTYNICNKTQNAQDYKEWLSIQKFQPNACVSKA